MSERAGLTAPMEALLGPLLQTGSGTTVPTSDAFAGKKYVGIYFSGHCERAPRVHRARALPLPA
jgi:hypothetical protein